VTATVLVIIFAPLFYVLIEMLFGKGRQDNTIVSGTVKKFFSTMKERLLKKRIGREATRVKEGNPED